MSPALAKTAERTHAALRQLAVLPIRAYQWVLSPLLPRSCRFAPSCSEYAAEAVLAHGLWRGMALAIGRLSRCHPWGGHGYDPVPPRPVPSPVETCDKPALHPRADLPAAVAPRGRNAA
jgi:uncharacterized protein